MRKVYIARLVGRCIVFIICGLLWFFNRELFDILNGWNFFDGFSPFHILWGIWVFDMLEQMIPITKKIPLGSAKHFAHRFRPTEIKQTLSKENLTKNAESLKKYIVSTSKAAYKVTLEVEPGGTVRQKRTMYDRQNADIDEAKAFIRKWQKEIRERMSGKDRKLAQKSKVLRLAEFAQMDKDNVLINTGLLQGQRLVDVLMADLMEVAA